MFKHTHIVQCTVCCVWGRVGAGARGGIRATTMEFSFRCPLLSYSLIIISDNRNCITTSAIIQFYSLSHSFIQVIWCMLHKQFMQNGGKSQCLCPIKMRNLLFICVRVICYALLYTHIYIYIVILRTRLIVRYIKITLTIVHLNRLANQSFLK